jgi:hypothetical protein
MACPFVKVGRVEPPTVAKRAAAWPRIWPELINTEGAPDVPAAAEPAAQEAA